MFFADASFLGPALLFYVLPCSHGVAGMAVAFLLVVLAAPAGRHTGDVHRGGRWSACSSASTAWTGILSPSSVGGGRVRLKSGSSRELKSKRGRLPRRPVLRSVNSPVTGPVSGGPRRDGRLAGVRIKTDWQQSPPPELWRHRIGPGWSSLAVVGDRLFTQEQRGEDEYVVCYDATNGAEVWSHHDATRFYEVVAGPGPRATPTFHAGRLYTFGANGHLNCLEAASGKPVWSHDVAPNSRRVTRRKTSRNGASPARR